jgi:uncharacterized protein with HEPN domain
MLEAIARIERYTAGLDGASFIADEKSSDAVVRNLEIIGEAAAHLPSEFTKSVDNIDWEKVVGLRNRIVHGYFAVDLELVWTIVKADISPLGRRLKDVHSSLLITEH